MGRPNTVFIEDDRTVGIPSARRGREVGGRAGLMTPGWQHKDAAPAEARSLWRDRPDVVARLTAFLGRCQQSGRSAPRR